ncbi:hypothetical protein DFH09DRAFT_1377583 [Mycena vulgaris]|nr:hypothetical protein DFH09DRAFT_1377583 [Mycena vulgaris]
MVLHLSLEIGVVYQLPGMACGESTSCTRPHFALYITRRRPITQRLALSVPNAHLRRQLHRLRLPAPCTPSSTTRASTGAARTDGAGLPCPPPPYALTMLGLYTGPIHVRCAVRYAQRVPSTQPEGRAGRGSLHAHVPARCGLSFTTRVSAATAAAAHPRPIHEEESAARAPSPRPTSANGPRGGTTFLASGDVADMMCEVRGWVGASET